MFCDWVCSLLAVKQFAPRDNKDTLNLELWQHTHIEIILFMSSGTLNI